MDSPVALGVLRVLRDAMHNSNTFSLARGDDFGVVGLTLLDSPHLQIDGKGRRKLMEWFQFWVERKKFPFILSEKPRQIGYYPVTSDGLYGNHPTSRNLRRWVVRFSEEKGQLYVSEDYGDMLD